MRPLKNADLGARTFFASCHAKDTCGNNGLPLTPNSIRILGCFQFLKTLIHPHLCLYLDILRSKHERLVVVSEHYKNNLEKKICLPLKIDDISTICWEILDALEYLHEKQIVHRALSPRCILFDKDGHAKLSNYGLNYMTENGTTVPFPIGIPQYLAPEILIKEEKVNPGPKADIWALGIIALELGLGKKLWKNFPLGRIFKSVLGCVKSGDALKKIGDDNGCYSEIQALPDDFKSFIEECLLVLPKERPPAKDLKNHKFVRAKAHEMPVHDQTIYSEFLPLKLKCERLNLQKNPVCIVDHLAERPLNEIYCLWQLAGGDVETELHKQGLIKAKPPICTLPSVVLLEGEELGQKKDTVFFFDDTTVILSMEQLRQRLKHVDPTMYYPLIETGLQDSQKSPGSDFQDTASLPIIIREKDIEYQLHRIILYNRLLAAYPYKRQQLIREAKVDIPPLYRANVWAGLLEVNGDLLSEYEAIDKETPSQTDRQIEVDIPRCHQYDELLSSPTAHGKFRRLLKAWVVSHPQYVYWQGLDSLCAPFLYLHFNNEALAYACLSTFISKYLHNFFLQDNSLVIKEYLAVFSHLIAFHDPELTNHLDSISFLPELYSIPWFLTMYTHVFPLHKIFHLWDTLLLGNNTFPLCIGVAILQQLRSDLLSFGFNECILLFSDMPEIDIQRCVQDSIRIFCATPPSATYREHTQASAKSSFSSSKGSASAELGMTPVPLDVLKAELSPRISADDLLHILALGRGDSNFSRVRLLVVDVRPAEEYVRGTVPGAVNIPFQAAFASDGLASTPEVASLAAHKGRMILVLGSKKDNNAANFANQIVRLGYPKVCLLHGGVEVLKTTDILVVPTAQ